MKAGYSNDLFLSSSLVIFYRKSGCLEGAHFVFGQLTLPNIVRKSVLMKLLVCLRRWGGVKMNSFTFSSVLKACRKLTDDGYYGRQVHAKAIKLGVNLKSYVQCGLVDMYGKFGLVRNARRVFEMNGVKKNAACWNAMLNAYIQHASCIEVVKAGYSNDLFLSSSLVIFYRKSGCLEGDGGGVKKNSFTFSSVLKACRKLTDDGYYGRQVHAKAIKLGVNLKSYVQCGLVDMYGKFGLVRNARRVFVMNGVKKNAACWNAMLNAYIQHGSCIEVVKVLYVMKGGGLEPRESLVNAVWFFCGSTNLENKFDKMF
ncbi:unnamed protein product [Ilex paraguariensis]|uniref:Pentatricopeptide repeat-containing protein n=1 Tax=Ilex paraguariensis TaxID=185542 RepID=A0ABC8TVE6_9AQUA